MNYRCAHRWAFPKWGGALEAMTEDLAAPAGHEVTVRITHCGMCHSDLHIQAGGFDMGGGKMSATTSLATKACAAFWLMRCCIQKPWLDTMSEAKTPTAARTTMDQRSEVRKRMMLPWDRS